MATNKEEEQGYDQVNLLPESNGLNDRRANQE